METATSARQLAPLAGKRPRRDGSSTLSAQTLSVAATPRRGVPGLGSFRAFVGGGGRPALPIFPLSVLVGEPGGLAQHLSSSGICLRQAPAQTPELCQQPIPNDVRTLVHRA